MRACSDARHPSDVGGAVGKITLPSTILQYWDLGGQRGIRSIWHRYYDDCHAVVFVLDAQDRERLGEGWEVFGTCLPNQFRHRCVLMQRKGPKTTFCQTPRYSASHHCCLPTSRTVDIASLSRRSGTTTRTGVVVNETRHGGDMETKLSWSTARTGWPASMSWVYPRSRGKSALCTQCTHHN